MNQIVIEIPDGLTKDDIKISFQTKKWKPKDGEQVWRISLYNPPQKIFFSCLSMRKCYECGMIYKTEKEAFEASYLLDSTLQNLFQKLNYAWQEDLT